MKKKKIKRGKLEKNLGGGRKAKKKCKIPIREPTIEGGGEGPISLPENTISGCERKSLTSTIW